MPDNTTIPSTPDPQLVTLIMAIIRGILLVLGGAGVMTASYTDAQLMPLAGAAAVIVSLSWQMYEQFRQARQRHAAAEASARAMRPVQCQDYTHGGTK